MRGIRVGVTAVAGLAACGALAAGIGVARGDAVRHLATVSFPAPTTTGMPVRPARSPLSPAPRLDGATLADAKALVAAQFHVPISPAPAGMPTPLTLDPSTPQATSGAVTGGLQLFDVYSEGPCVGPWQCTAGTWLAAPPRNQVGGGGAVELRYVGLSIGSAYLLDCTVSGLVSGGAFVQMSGSNQTLTSVASVSAGHLLASWLETSSRNALVLVEAGQMTNANADSWAVHSCTLNQVN
jgi:hypothetical protein